MGERSIYIDAFYIDERNIVKAKTIHPVKGCHLMGITPIVRPQPAAKPSVSSVVTPTLSPKPMVQPPEPPSLNGQWFKAARRSFAEWNRGIPPLPVTGNQVVPYIHLMDYYAALGQAIRNTRPNMADFVYIAGWELDLDTFIDLPGATPRQTLREVLSAATARGVEVRVLLPDQPNEAQNRSVTEQVGKIKGGGIVDPFHKLIGTHHQKLVILRNAEGIVAFCGGSDIANARLGRDGVRGGEKPADGQMTSAGWHDVQVRVQGPAAADLWNSFVQRFKELAQVYLVFYPISANPVSGITAHPPLSVREPDFAASKTDRQGLDIQVVRTYPNMQKQHIGDQLIVRPRQPGYSFAPNGEMGIYELLAHAISQTSKMIYLEDQYLVNSTPMGQHPPITEALRKTIEKPSFVKMIILVHGTPAVQPEICQAGSRRAEFINQLGDAAAQKVAVYVYKSDRNSPYWFHSKTWIFDDQFAVVSSANCNRRGYSHDSEIGVGISGLAPGGQIPFAKRLRMDLWLKHINTQPTGAKAGQFRIHGDVDVQDFSVGASLWDKAPLLEKVDFTRNPEPDIPAQKKINDDCPRVAKLYGKIQGRDLDWSFLDPNGS